MPIQLLDDSFHKDLDFDTTDPVVVSHLWSMEERHFWYGARNSIINGMLKKFGLNPPASILEIGCGSGAVLMNLAKQGYKVSGVDTARILLEKADTRLPDIDLFLGDVSNMNDQRKFNAIALFDVIEHLDDPRTIVQSGIDLLFPNSFVIVTVPSLMKYYTDVDAISGHKKRYEPGELSSLFNSLGLTDVYETGFFVLTGIIQSIWRKRKRNYDISDQESRRQLALTSSKIPNRYINGALSLLSKLESMSYIPDRFVDRFAASRIAIGRTR